MFRVAGEPPPRSDAAVTTCLSRIILLLHSSPLLRFPAPFGVKHSHIMIRPPLCFTLGGFVPCVAFCTRAKTFPYNLTTATASLTRMCKNWRHVGQIWPARSFYVVLSRNSTFKIIVVFKYYLINISVLSVQFQIIYR